MSEQDKNVLILLAHPAIRRSEVNRPLARMARRLVDVTFVDLYAEYPVFDINIDKEQDRLRAHDIIILQFPFYWYSTPSILKEWQDLVLEYGFAYGHEGKALEGKVLLCAVSTGGPHAAYMPDGYNRFTMRQLLAPVEQMADLCGMTYLPPLVLHGARSALEEGTIPGHIAHYRRVIEALQDDRLNIGRAAEAATLNDVLDSVIEEE